MPQPSKEYTQLTVITTLPPWFVSFVNEWILVTAANWFGKEVFSTQHPADEDENDKAPEQAA